MLKWENKKSEFLNRHLYHILYLPCQNSSTLSYSGIDNEYRSTAGYEPLHTHATEYCTSFDSLSKTGYRESKIYRTEIKAPFLYFNLYLSVILHSLSCSLTPWSFLTDKLLNIGCCIFVLEIQNIDICFREITYLPHIYYI